MVVTPHRTTGSALPRTIWALGLASLFMDMSSELVHALLPLLMVNVLGASVLMVGIIEGIAEATAAITKLFSGTLSDRWRRRKPLLVLGYGLAALTKPVFPLAGSLGWIMAARFVDRIGKGIRGAPRDALVADVTPPDVRGAAYGLRQALDSVGAVLGPLLAILLMLVWAGDVQQVLWVAVIPALITVLILLMCVREPAQHVHTTPTAIHWRNYRQLAPAFWQVVGIAAVFTLARFSEAFLILRAQDTGVATVYVPAVMILMNLVYAAGSYPAGGLADRWSAHWLLAAGLVVLVMADLLLALSTNPWLTLAGAACWGAHMALTQGLFSKLVADTAPQHLRGTAFGVYNLVTGVALLLASAVAGGLWSALGAAVTFYAGAGFATLALLGLLWLTRRNPTTALPRHDN